MIYSLQFSSMDDGYSRLVAQVSNHGITATPRGLACHEIRPHVFEVTCPELGLYRGVSRRMNYRFFAVETLQYIAGWGDKPKHAELLMAVNGNLNQFLNFDTGMFDGAYGPRLKAGLPYCYHALQNDPYTRQAVASIWSPGGPMAGSRDVPCTLNLHFYRDLMWEGSPNADGFKPRLGCTATMRSNDLNWGVPYDVAAFCAIQLAMAGCLGWRHGSYNHHNGSLHLYDEKMPTIKDPREERFCQLYLPDLGKRLRGEACGWEFFSTIAGWFLDELYEHVVTNQKPCHEFKSYLEPDAESFPAELALFGHYWSDWADLIRFRWSDVKC
jgi:hypothetical protein